MTEYPKKTISAIVLAGGESSRMGQDKALLPLANQTLLAKICHVAAECTARVYIVTPWIEKYQHIVPQNCQIISETIILPHQTSNCPIIGFVQGLRQINTDWALLLACDLPRLSSSHIKLWSEDLKQVSASQIALLPRNAKGWEPLCGFYRRSCLSFLEAYIATGGKSFQGFLAQHSIAELSVSDRNCLFNCNTPEDWRRILRLESA